jgi:hypothetical protein
LSSNGGVFKLIYFKKQATKVTRQFALSGMIAFSTSEFQHVVSDADYDVEDRLMSSTIDLQTDHWHAA